jgi:hypothetical protein
MEDKRSIPLSSIFNSLSSILKPLSSILYPPSSIFYPLSSTLRYTLEPQWS